MEAIANLSVSWVLTVVVCLTALRLAFIRVPTTGMRAIVEYIDVALTAIVLVFLLLRPFVVQAYFIPSQSMEPTLHGKNGSGDRILVNKFKYRLPGSHGPERDDVVVFIPPPEAFRNRPEVPTGIPINYIKRLIGLPGDRIQAVHGTVLIKNIPFSHTQVLDKLFAAGTFGQVDLSDSSQGADHSVKFTDNGVLADGKLITSMELAKILVGDENAKITIKPGYLMRNDQRLTEPFIAEDPDYDLQIYHGQPLKWLPEGGPTGEAYKLNGLMISPEDYARFHAMKPEPIPAGHYFMMGDNRNDSEDSTEWGPLDEHSVVGKAQFIFWPPDRIRAIH
jgi:signal peptidase I